MRRLDLGVGSRFLYGGRCYEVHEMGRGGCLDCDAAKGGFCDLMSCGSLFRGDRRRVKFLGVEGGDKGVKSALGLNGLKVEILVGSVVHFGRGVNELVLSGGDRKGCADCSFRGDDGGMCDGVVCEGRVSSGGVRFERIGG